MANLIETQGDLEPLSGVETFKGRSGGLYGPVAGELGEATACFTDESVQILKHHGTYQQDNRDTRKARKKAGLDKEYTMMLRTKFPGGLLTAEQYLLCDTLSDRYGRGDMRTTSRQDFQFHGVLKGNLRGLIADLNRLGEITSLGGCGDVVRNTMANPVADIDTRYAGCGEELIAMALEISAATLPKTRSYYDLWLNDEKATVREDGTVAFVEGLRETVEEPLYGAQYLPRKFKIGLATDFDNASDIYTQDVGVMAVTEGGRVAGYEVLAGGGLGFSHTKATTYGRMATPVAFVQREEVLPLILAIVKVQRDYGDRTDRKQARLKYTIDGLGVERFRALVVEYAGRDFPAPRGARPTGQFDYLGWHAQAQEGLHYVGVWVENGRIRDNEGGIAVRTGLRAVIDRYRPSVRVTPHHNLVLANIAEADVAGVQAMLEQYGLATDRGISTLRRMEMACPALPLCPLAQSEAERVMPSFMAGLEAAGHGDAEVTIRMTGCPNGCARSTSSEIGLIGKGPGRYILRTGGDWNGTRLNEELAPVVKEEEVVPLIGKLLDLWQAERAEGERFGDWSHRVGVAALRHKTGLETAS